MITVNGHEFRTLDDNLYVGGKKVYEAFANGVKVYPEEDVGEYKYAVKLGGYSQNATITDQDGEGSGSITEQLPAKIAETAVIVSKRPLYLARVKKYNVTYLSGASGVLECPYENYCVYVQGSVAKDDVLVDTEISIDAQWTPKLITHKGGGLFSGYHYTTWPTDATIEIFSKLCNLHVKTGLKPFASRMFMGMYSSRDNLEVDELKDSLGSYKRTSLSQFFQTGLYLTVNWLTNTDSSFDMREMYSEYGGGATLETAENPPWEYFGVPYASNDSGLYAYFTSRREATTITTVGPGWSGSVVGARGYSFVRNGDVDHPFTEDHLTGSGSEYRSLVANMPGLSHLLFGELEPIKHKDNDYLDVYRVRETNVWPSTQPFTFEQSSYMM